MTRTALYRTAMIAIALVALSSTAALFAQDLHPSRRASPMGIARTDVGDAYVSITYSRPYERGRDVIFGSEEDGALVPYGKHWRTGANEATQLTATADITVGGETLPAGTYSVYTIPGAESWTLSFSSTLGGTGTMRRNAESGELEDAYSPDNDVLSIEVAPTELAEEDKVDQFTIAFEEVDEATHLVLSWITTQIRVPVGNSLTHVLTQLFRCPRRRPSSPGGGRRR